MITQTKIGLNSRSEANPFNEDGFLPLITAPMYSVVDESNYQVFLDNKIQVCLPRNTLHKIKAKSDLQTDQMFVSYSLDDFEEVYIDNHTSLESIHKICIDTANGNIPNLHDFIREAKQIHGSNLIIMAGNVGSVEAFVELAKTGVDYIRVGIGGGGGCNTTSNTGVGQETLDKLIAYCKMSVGSANNSKTIREIKRNQYLSVPDSEYFDICYQEFVNISKVKIVADGISSYINYCQKEYNFNDNGYAAINKLLNAGADLVMVGKLFAQCVESAGEKACVTPSEKSLISNASALKLFKENLNQDSYISVEVKYSGMSTQQEQKKYKSIIDDARKLRFSKEHISIGEWTTDEKQDVKPSEGSVQWIPVRWTLNEWLNGSDKQDESPYLMGFVNALRSMMAYTNRTKL